MEMPSFENLAPNLNKVTIGPVSVWFSYDTVIGFWVGRKVILHENIWTKTTGKHLNMIEERYGQCYRYNSNDFKGLWDKEVGDLMVSGLFQ